MSDVNYRKPDRGACMVKGCSRAALYRNPASKRHGSLGGYCYIHRDRAVTNAVKAAADQWADVESTRED